MKPWFLLSAVASGLLIGGAAAQTESTMGANAPIAQPAVSAPTNTTPMPKRSTVPNLPASDPTSESE